MTTQHKRKAIPQKTRDEVRARDGTRCYLCSRVTTKQNRHLDHIVPVSAGGNNDASNLRVCCKRCNTARGDKPLAQFVRDQIKTLEAALATLKKLHDSKSLE